MHSRQSLDKSETKQFRKEVAEIIAEIKAQHGTTQINKRTFCDLINQSDDILNALLVNKHWLTDILGLLLSFFLSFFPLLWLEFKTIRVGFDQPLIGFRQEHVDLETWP